MTAQAPMSRPRPRRVADPRRFGAIVAVALVALLAGVVAGARHVPQERRLGEAVAAAWEHRDYGAMYALLSDAARARTSRGTLQHTYEDAAGTLTLERVRTGRVH